LKSSFENDHLPAFRPHHHGRAVTDHVCISSVVCDCADGVKPGKKRMYRDAKFGFGGRKKLRKQNTAESSADMNAMFKDRSKGGSKGTGKLGPRGGVKKRPGKTARLASKGKQGSRKQ
jgi:hypothetical protein